ncbi:MAG: beta strand repeat-containing protein, partial [Betaproteobacteria bacterium]
MVANAAGEASQGVTLSAPTQPSGASTGARLTLPTSLIATSGAKVPLLLGALLQSAAGTDAVVLDIEAPSDRLSFTLTSDVTTGAGANFTLVEGGTVHVATRLTGTVDALNNFFSQPGAAWYDTSFATTLKLRVVGAVSSVGAIAITTKPAAEAAVAGPTLAIPASFSVPTLGGDLRLAPNAITGSGTLTVTVAAASGAFAVVNDDAVAVDSGLTANADGVLVGGSALARTFTGTASALNAYLSAAGKLRYSGSAGTLAISVASDGAQGAVVTAAGEATLTGLGSQTQAPSLSLTVPAALNTAQGAASTALIFANDVVAVAGGSGAVTLSLTAPASGVLTAFSDDAASTNPNADGVLVASSTAAGRQTITLTGTPAAINAWLKVPGNLQYQGASGTLEWVAERAGLRATSQIALNAVPMRASPGLVLPQSFEVVAGASTALLLGLDRLQFTGAGNLALTLSVTGGSLSADVAGITPAPTVASVTSGSRITSLTLTGTVDALDALIAAGQLRFTGTASDTVQISVQSVDVAALRAQGEFGITIAATSGARATPTISLPDRLALQSAGSTPVRFANAPFAAGSASTLVAATLEAPANAVLVARATGGAAIASTETVVSDASVTVTGSGTGTLVVRGTVDAVNGFIGAANRIELQHATGCTTSAPAGTLRVGLAIDPVAPATVSAASASASVRLQTPSLGGTPSIVALPASMPITADSTSDLRFAGVDLSDNTASGSTQPKLKLSLELPGRAALSLGAGQGLSLVSSAGVALDAAALTALTATVTPRLITVTGTASELEALLEGAGNRVTYEGPALASGAQPLQLQLSVANAVGASSV